MYGERGFRRRARQILESLTHDGVAVPTWVASLGVAEPVQAVLVRDQWDEHTALVIDYARPDGSVHELWASLHPFSWGMAHNFSVLPATAAPERTVDAGHVIEAVSLEEARTVLDRGLAQLDEVLRMADEVGIDEFGSDADLRSLVGQRVELLPGGNGSAAAAAAVPQPPMPKPPVPQPPMSMVPMSSIEPLPRSQSSSSSRCP